MPEPRTIFRTVDGRAITPRDKAPTNDLYSRTIQPYVSLLGDITPDYIRSCFSNANSGYLKDQALLFAEMLEKDGQIRRIVERLKQDVASTTWSVHPSEDAAAGDATHNAAQERADWLYDELDRLPIRQMLNDAMDAAFYGVALLECQWENNAADGVTRIARVLPVEPRRIKFDTQTGRIMVDERGEGKWAELPAWRYLVFTNSATSGYPPRQGLLRPVAYWFILKLLTLRALSIYLERCSTPLLLGTHPANLQAGSDDITDFETALQEAGLNSYIRMPDTFKVDFATPSGSIDVFTETIRQCDTQISDTVLGQSFLTVESMYGTYDKGEDAEWVTFDIKEYYCQSMTDAFNEQLVTAYLFHNFGEEGLADRPYFRLDYEHEDDLERNVKVVKELVALGFPVSGRAIEEQYGKVAVKYDPTDADDWQLKPEALPTMPQPTAGEPEPPEGESGADAANPGEGMEEGTDEGMAGGNLRARTVGPVGLKAQADDLLESLTRLSARKSSRMARGWLLEIRRALTPFIESNDSTGALAALRATVARLAKDPKTADKQFAGLVMRTMLAVGAEALGKARTGQDFEEYLGRVGK